jgi:hypothetical protein
VARRDVTPDQPAYDAAGNPIDLLPQRQQLEPLPPPQTVLPPAVQRPVTQQQLDDGYIYGSDGQRYPAPRGYHRQYDAQAAPQQQYYYDNGRYVPQVYAPQVYAPRPAYRQRGFFTE